MQTKTRLIGTAGSADCRATAECGSVNPAQGTATEQKDKVPDSMHHPVPTEIIRNPDSSKPAVQDTRKTGNCRKKPDATTPHLKNSIRATALRGLSIARPLESKSSRRRQALLDICHKNSEIPYLKLDAAIRDLVRALLERQDRMNEVLFCKFNDLEYRIGNLEEDQTAGWGRI